MRLSYIDDEGDDVTICTDEELAEAVRFASRSKRVLKFTVLTDSSNGTSSSSEAVPSSSTGQKKPDVETEKVTDPAQQVVAAAAEEEELEQGGAIATTELESVDDLDAAMDAAMQEFLLDNNGDYGSGSSNVSAAAESASAQDEPQTPGLNFSEPEYPPTIDGLDEADQPTWLQVFARQLTPLLIQLQQLLRVLALPSNEAKMVLVSMVTRAATSNDPCGTFARLLHEHDQVLQAKAVEERQQQAENSAEPDSPDTMPPTSAKRGPAESSEQPPLVSLLQSLATQYLVAGSAGTGATKTNPLAKVVQQLMRGGVAALPPQDVQSAVFNVVQQALSSSDVASTLSAMLGQQHR